MTLPFQLTNESNSGSTISQFIKVHEFIGDNQFISIGPQGCKDKPYWSADFHVNPRGDVVLIVQRNDYDAAQQCIVLMDKERYKSEESHLQLYTLELRGEHDRDQVYGDA